MAVRKPKQSKLSRCLKAPFRLLVRAKELYVKSITEYSDKVVSYGTIPTPGPILPVDMMRRSFSVNSAKSTQHDDDYRELLRAASTRSLKDKAVCDQAIKVWSQKSPMNKMTRSQSVGIGRIDEDAPLIDFEDDVKVKHPDVLPRSRTYAAPNNMISLI